MSNREQFKIGDREHAPKPYHYTECGLSNIYLLNGFQFEDHEGEQYVSVEDIDGLWKAIGLNIVSGKKLIAGEEVRFLRQQMNFTQAELAARLRVDDQTVARWEKGKSHFPGPADVALRVLYLASKSSQPEGRELLSDLMTAINELVEQDTPPEDKVIFQWDSCEWNARLRA